MPTLSFDTYGKTRVRLLQVLRNSDAHEVVEINVTILFEGELADSYVMGDNSNVLPTDTMKNTVYALARQNPIESIEEFGLILGKHFLDRLPHVDKVNISIEQTPWDRIGSHAAAFVQSSKEQRTTAVRITRENKSIRCGLRNLQILKTSQSAFYGYLRDEYTTLPEARDRLLGTVVDADWSVSPAQDAGEFNRLHSAVRTVLLDCFATHESLSVQHTLYAMGEAVLAHFAELADIHLVMPNKHCLLFDLSRFGLDNPNQIFVPTDEPSGLIEARLTR
jgi:urate oxidase